MAGCVEEGLWTKDSGSSAKDNGLTEEKDFSSTAEKCFARKEDCLSTENV